MSLPFTQDTSVQLTTQTTFTSSTDYINLNDWSKSGNNLNNTSLGNVGIGTTALTTYKLNVNGSVNLTSLYQGGILIDFANFATDSELTSGLALKQDKINTYSFTGGSGGSIGFLSVTLSLVMPTSYSTLTIASLTSGTSFIYKGVELSTTLNSYTPFTALLSSNYATYTGLNSCNYITNATTGLNNYPSYSALALSNYANYTQLNSCNYITNSTTGLNNYPSYSALASSNNTPFSALASSNYITNSTTSLNNYPSYTALASSNYITNNTSSLNNYPSYTALASSNYTPFSALASCNYITNSTSGLTNYTRTGLDPAYLLKTGGTMTGGISGVSTLNATTGIFGQITTTNNTNVGAPTNGVNGGTGDKLILFAGAVGALPYSLGIDDSTLWYSVPIGATHKFYSGGGNPKMTILGNGNIGIGIINPFELLCVGNPSSASDGTIVISKNVSGGGNRNFKIGIDSAFNFCIGDYGNNVIDNFWKSTYFNISWLSGNIGINTAANSISEKLYVNGNTTINGDATLSGNLYVGSYTNQKYGFLGGLRIGGWDGNTLYNSDKVLGLTALNNIIFNTGTNLANYATRMTIDTSGNVGIGTAPTFQKLEVNGDTNFTGSLSVQSGDLNTYRTSGGIFGNFNCAGNITCLLYAIDNSGTDYVGVGNVSANNQNWLRQLYIMYGTFTGFHRCFTNDELFDNENPQDFKDNYIGRIVVSTGKIATDLKSIDNDDWEIKYDKQGITIEDALPMIELSRKKKDKRVFGVMGSAKRGNSRNDRLIINSVGEGGIFVCNSNGNIENGDYITSSDYLGYGEKQDDDLLHNYSVAKATIDCSFELESPLYECFEIDDLDTNGNKLRVAFISCSYHCG